MAPAIQSDLAYSGFLIGSLGALALGHDVTFALASEMLLLSALVALAPFGLSFLRTQVSAIKGNPRRYWPVFRDLSRWSLMGVALTEVTVNAHAYLVTFISGPGAFALLALGMLLMRPASLMQSALPDLERPAMMRAWAARDGAKLDRILFEFHAALGAVLLGTILLAAALLLFEPQLLLKQGYGLGDAVTAATHATSTLPGRRLPAHTLDTEDRRRSIPPSPNCLLRERFRLPKQTS